MTYRLLDDRGKAIPRSGKSKRAPAEKLQRGAKLYHYDILVAIKQAGGAYKHIRRRAWLPDDLAAAEMERELSRKPSTKAVTWEDAFSQWVDGNIRKRSPRHIANVEATKTRWTAAFGANKRVEDTSLAEFTGWIRERSKTGKGRGAQLDQAHLLAVARWCRENGLIDTIPFDHAPSTESRAEERPPATAEEYHAVDAILPLHMSLIWRLLAYTGMRLGAACGLLEADIGDHKFTVTTKGEKRVTFSLVPQIRDIIDEARKWKAERAFVKPYLFCNTRGERWTSKSFGKRLSRIIEEWNDEKQLKKHPERVKVPKLTAHQLRHLAGTTLGESGVELPGIMALLDHEKEDTSLIYTHKTQKMRDQGVDLYRVHFGFR